jgi:hypothetical protein
MILHAEAHGANIYCGGGERNEHHTHGEQLKKQKQVIYDHCV